METVLLLSLTLIVALGISFYAILSLWYKQDKKAGTTTLPPGEKGWPFLGESLEFLRLGLSGNPEKFITDRMIKHSPKAFMTSLFGANNMVAFCGASGNKCLLSSEKNSVIPWIPASIKNLLVSPHNTRWLESKNYNGGRGVVNVFIKPEALQQKFVGVMDFMSRQHIDKKWAPHQQVIVLELIKKHVFSLACRLFVSIEDPEEVTRLEGIFEGAAAGLLSIPINFPGTTFYRAMKCANAFRKELLTIIKKRRVDLLDDRSDYLGTSLHDMLSQLLLSANEHGEFRNDIEIIDMILGFFIAGQDTTSTIITFIVKYLAELPHVYAEVLKEQLEIANNKKPGELLNWKDIQQMKYTWSVANEAMRLAPPAQGGFREATTDFSYAGFTIPKGCKAYWTVYSTNKNPEYFENPEKFDPLRFLGNGPAPYSFIPFGGGPHICPGREYARIVVLVFIHNLVTQFELEKLLLDEKTIYMAGATPANGLPIRLHRRNVQTT